MDTNPANQSLPRTVEALGETVVIDLTGAAVESKSNPGHFHRLTMLNGYAVGCECPGYVFRQRCRHVAAANEAIRLSVRVEYSCNCWKPRPGPRDSELWSVCQCCGGSL